MKRAFKVAAVMLMAVTSLSFQQSPKFNLKASMARGQEIYTAQCVSCHLQEGQGIEDVYPPLAKSDYMMADKKRSIIEILYGVSGEIKVNDRIYNGDMSGFDLTNEEVSDLLNFVRNSWGNKGEAVTPEEVRQVRK